MRARFALRKHVLMSRDFPMRWHLHRRGAETVLAGVALLGLGFAVLAPHVLHGGFYSDDWANAAGYRFDGWWRTSVDEWRHAIPGRPILALLHPLPYALFGLDPTYHLALAIMLAALTSLSFFVFLRTLGFELPHALVMALLSIAFPWSGAARLWPTGAMNNLAVIAYFLGSVAALRALALWDADRRRSVVLHVGAAALYLASILTYEVAPAAILLSGLLYRTQVRWRALRVGWLVDVVLVLVPLVISQEVTSRVRHVGSLHDRAVDLPEFVGQSLTLFASIFVPPSVTSSWTDSWQITSPSAGKLVVLGVALVIVLVAVARCRSVEEHELRTWLYRLAGGVCGVAAAYLMFLGSGLVPLFYPGVDDRTNTLAAFGFVVAAYSLVAVLGTLIGGRRRGVQAAVVAAGVVVVGVGFVQRVRTDAGHYDAATVEQGRFLERLRRAVPEPPRNSTIFTFGYRPEVAPGVPIFKYTWDLRGAVVLTWNDPSLRAVPVFGRNVSCGRRRIGTPEFGGGSATAYGQAMFVNVPAGRARRIESRRACVQARDVFKPGSSAAPLVELKPS
jgi:hypothetical protein